MPPLSAEVLPVDAHLPAIVDALTAHAGVVVVAEPGAGKTTRVPVALLHGGFAADGEIWVLQPRRIAARMAARRVALMLARNDQGPGGSGGDGAGKVGGTVGYQVRFERRAGPDTRVRFVTEGILTRRLTRDPTLAGIAAVVLDEFHERSLHADLALRCLRVLQRGARPDLRLVVMSATIDAEPVADFLGCPVIQVPGRLFPVDLAYQEDQPAAAPLARRVVAAFRGLVRDGLAGDVLAFLPGAAEIARARKACEPVCRAADVELAVLHGDLPADQQDRAVASGRRPKLILSTNIAETSLTLPGVVAVIDSGLARVPGHNPWTGLPTLTTQPISRASASQRAGRAGRVRPGCCIRLFGRHDFSARPAHDVPEIMRSDLCELVLTLAGLGPAPSASEWLQPPPETAFRRAHGLLVELGALSGFELTDRGRAMLRLPLHPRLAALLLEADAQGVAPEGAAVAALLGERDILRRSRPGLTAGPSAAASARTGPSDLLERLDLLDGRADAGAEGIDRGAIRNVLRVRDRLLRALPAAASGGSPSRHDAGAVPEQGTEIALGKAVLAAFPDRVARRRRPGKPELVLAHGGAVTAAPESVVRAAEFVVVVDVLDAGAGRGRSQVARVLSAIEPDWLLDLFPERVLPHARTRFDPDSERVDCFTGLSFAGLTLDEARAEPAGEAVEQALREAAREHGLSRLFDLEAADAFLRRWAFAAARADLPRLPDDPIGAAVALACRGHCSFADLRRAPLVAHLQALLGHAHLPMLDRVAPERVQLPGGRRLVVHYEPDRPPWVASFLQDFFGQTEGPRLAGEPLVLHLLAPNRRAVQVTQDLAGFWQRHYPALRRTLMRRYPKHAWPERPV